jgi:hypothetical protein
MTAPSVVLTHPRVVTIVPFALPIGLSAFLLFSVQPLVGRLVLPAFGGTPAVWATILFFFQAILLVGYLYGHVSVTRFGLLGPPLHLGLAVLAVVALAAGPARVSELRSDSITPVLDLVRILMVLIGLPALVLTTTTPLVSGWFEAARSRQGGDAYWLYALSNGGSLLALFAYPLVIEPQLGLSAQREAWAVAYAALVVLLAIAASRAIPALRTRRDAEDIVEAPTIGGASAVTAEATAGAGGASVVDWRRRGRWLLLAAIPSGLLSAVTTFIATDLVSAPLLWVLPLGIYLLTFVIAFSPRSGRWVGRFVVAAPAMITLLWVPYGSAGGWPVLAILVMELVAFGVTAAALHGRLASDRPEPGRLTEFYLILSLGGALASAFVALFAPIVFPGVWELPILLVGALVALALTSAPAPARQRAERGLDFGPFIDGWRWRLLPYLVAAAGLTTALLVTSALATEAGIRWLLVGGLILAVGGRPWFLTVATALVLLLATFVLQPPAEFRGRSFFGLTEVISSPDGELKLLMNGTTVHGSQSTDPTHRRMAQSYYASAGPAGDLFRVGAPTGTEAVGVAGLGGGGLATYVTAELTMTFFEIDPVVIDVASDPRYFTYLSDAPRRPLIVEGDARLSFEDQPDGSFEMLILDAFSSDSVPVHLLTFEAISEQIRITSPDGLLAFHVSNRYYDLAPAIAAAVLPQGLAILEKRHQPGDVREPGETPSRWLAASRDPTRLDALRAAGWVPVTPSDRPFTDDYADLIRYLHLGG